MHVVDCSDGRRLFHAYRDDFSMHLIPNHLRFDHIRLESGQNIGIHGSCPNHVSNHSTLCMSGPMDRYSVIASCNWFLIEFVQLVFCEFIGNFIFIYLICKRTIVSSLSSIGSNIKKKNFIFSGRGSPMDRFFIN